MRKREGEKEKFTNKITGKPTEVLSSFFGVLFKKNEKKNKIIKKKNQHFGLLKLECFERKIEKRKN